MSRTRRVAVGAPEQIHRVGREAAPAQHAGAAGLAAKQPALHGVDDRAERLAVLRHGAPGAHGAVDVDIDQVVAVIAHDHGHEIERELLVELVLERLELLPVRERAGVAILDRRRRRAR